MTGLGVPELVALLVRRAVRSRTAASSSAARRSRAAMRPSRSRQPGQVIVAMTPSWQAGKAASAPRTQVTGYVLPSPDVTERRDGVRLPHGSRQSRGDIRLFPLAIQGKGEEAEP